MQPSSDADLISELGALLGIPSLRADEQGRCHLMFDGCAVVEIRHVPAQSRWLLTCGLEKRTLSAESLKLLLRGNWMGAGFAGGWVGVDEQDCVVLHLPMAVAEASAQALLQAIESLLSHAEQWEKRLAESAASQHSPTAPMEMWAQRI